MKKAIILFVCIFVSVAQAKIWRVDQNTAVQADYHTTLQPVLNAVTAGDTILVSGYGSSYGNIVVDKKIVIIGPGYFLDQYYNTTVNQNSVQLGSVSFHSGGENSVIMGCNIASITISCNNVVIERNYLKSNYTNISASGDNLVVQQNYMETSTTDYNNCISGFGNNIIVRNNYMKTASVYTMIDLSGSGIISNNVLVGRVLGHGFNIYNNILTSAKIEQTDSFVNNNMVGVDISSVFIGTGTTDGKWQLKDGSPAKGAGMGGTDCGMFGGDFPYVLSGIPPIPTIYDAIVPPTGNSRDGLQIRIKARTNK